MEIITVFSCTFRVHSSSHGQMCISSQVFPLYEVLCIHNEKYYKNFRMFVCFLYFN